jgi:oligopeptide transport system ATP-binding protein
MNGLSVQGLTKTFVMPGPIPFVGQSVHKVLDGLSFAIPLGKTYGLVGESGSGKTTTGRIIVGLTTTDSGQVHFAGHDLLAMDKRRRRAMAADIQYVFQDSLASLPGHLCAGAILEEVLTIHRLGDRCERRDRALQMLGLVGLRPEHYAARPHQLSGGQRQRLNIARALIVEPSLIVCDEPVSALDVSVQAQILNLLQDLQERFGLTMLFISHDIGVVRHMSDIIGVIYQGHIAEEAPPESLLTAPEHPYTRQLLAAVTL